MKGIISAVAIIAALMGVICCRISSWASRYEEKESPCPYCELWNQCKGKNERCFARKEIK